MLLFHMLFAAAGGDSVRHASTPAAATVLTHDIEMSNVPHATEFRRRIDASASTWGTPSVAVY